MDNAELIAKIDRVIDALEKIETALTVLCERRIDEQDRVELAQERARQIVGATGWPWTPDTVTQGFLAARWLRRPGDVYGGAARRGVPGPNSPIAGGDDNQAKIDVPSGAPRA